MTCCMFFLHQIDFFAKALIDMMFNSIGFSTICLCIATRLEPRTPIGPAELHLNLLCASSDQSSSSSLIASNMYGASSRGATPENDRTEPDGETTYCQGIVESQNVV